MYSMQIVQHNPTPLKENDHILNGKLYLHSYRPEIFTIVFFSTTSDATAHPRLFWPHAPRQEIMSYSQ